MIPAFTVEREQVCSKYEGSSRCLKLAWPLRPLFDLNVAKRSPALLQLCYWTAATRRQQTLVCDVTGGRKSYGKAVNRGNVSWFVLSRVAMATRHIPQVRFQPRDLTQPQLSVVSSGGVALFIFSWNCSSSARQSSSWVPCLFCTCVLVVCARWVTKSQLLTSEIAGGSGSVSVAAEFESEGSWSLDSKCQRH